MAITLADFNKIWASTSPLTPYSFSESNYKQGWNFVGSTPPARQMWDFLQKNNDEKMQYLANNYLPLSGGTLTGTLEMTGKTIHFVDGSDPAVAGSGGWIGGVGSGLRIAAENYGYLQAGGRIELRGRNYASNAGMFDIIAADNNNTKSLTGYPNGTLTWDGNAIALAKDVLPLSGGTMTGSIITTAGESFRRDINTSYLRIMGGDSSTNGSSLALFGKDHSSQAGEFMLRARDGSSLVDLSGKPDGTLTWGGKSVIVGTEATETFTDVAFEPNGQAKVGDLSHAAKYYSIFYSGSGYAFVNAKIGSDRKSIYAFNASDQNRTISFTVNYIY